MSEKRATKPTTGQGMEPVEEVKVLVRMGRLELPRALHPLKPKCILEAPSGTNFLPFQIVPQQQAQRSSSEKQPNPADNLRLRLWSVGVELLSPDSGVGNRDRSEDPAIWLIGNKTRATLRSRVAENI